MKAIQDFHRGLKAVIEGFQFLRKTPGLKVWALIPFVIDILLVTVGLVWGFALIPEYVAGLVGWVLAPQTIWHSLFYYPLLLISWVVLIVLVNYAVFLLASVIAAPFNSLLAERSLIQLGVIQDRPFQLKAWLGTTIRMTLAALIKAMIFFLLGLAILVLSFIPVLNVGASFAALLVMTFDSYDYSFEILEWGIRRRFRQFLKHFPEASGMASFMALTLVVPGLTLLLLSPAVVGAAQLIKGWEELNDSRTSP